MASGPLATLYQSNNKIGNLVYPKNLGSSRTGHWITFQISTPTASTYKKDEKPIVSVVDPTVTQGPLNGVAITGTNQIASLNSDTITAVSNMPENDKFWEWTVTPGSTKLVDVISLYTPDTVSISQRSVYDSFSLTEELGFAGRVAEAAGGVGTLYNNGRAELNSSLKNLGIESGITAITGSKNLAAAALKTQGAAVNPMMEVIFNQIKIRTYQFDFLFSPKSADEAATVVEIIKKFKLHAAPEIDTNGSGRYFIVPSVFNVEFYFNGKQNPNIHKIGLSVLETINVDYAPQGWVTHEDGMPVQTRMTLQFTETEIMTKQKIEQGY